RDRLDGRARPLGDEPKRLVSDEMIVPRRDDLVALLEREAAVHDGKAGGRAVRQRDLVARDTHVAGRAVEGRVHSCPAVKLFFEDIYGVLVEEPAIGGYRVTDRTRVRGDEEVAEVDSILGEQKILTEGGPPSRGRCGRDCPRNRSAGGARRS